MEWLHGGPAANISSRSKHKSTSQSKWLVKDKSKTITPNNAAKSVTLAAKKRLITTTMKGITKGSGIATTQNSAATAALSSSSPETTKIDLGAKTMTTQGLTTKASATETPTTKTSSTTTTICHFESKFGDLNKFAEDHRLDEELQQPAQLGSNPITILENRRIKNKQQKLQQRVGDILVSPCEDQKMEAVEECFLRHLVRSSTAQHTLVNRLNNNNFDNNKKHYNNENNHLNNNNKNINKNNETKYHKFINIKPNSPCLYQKALEVLLVLLLANILASLAGTQAPSVAAHSTERNQGSKQRHYYNEAQEKGAGSYFDDEKQQDKSNELLIEQLQQQQQWNAEKSGKRRSEFALDKGENESETIAGLPIRTPRRLPSNLGNQHYDFDRHSNNNINSGEDYAPPLPSMAQFQRSGTGGFGSQNYKISPKPCSVGRIEGTCMFVWECIKSEGRHVGMCVDSFMFGSCCAHNYTENIVLPQTFWYTRPTKPYSNGGASGGQSQRPRPPHMPHKHHINGMTTIERPHNAGTLVIRGPSGPHHQGSLHRPVTKLPATTATATTSTAQQSPFSTSALQSALVSNDAGNEDLQSAASIVGSASNSWHSSSVLPSQVLAFSTGHQHHWQMTTEPNFITKPRPPSWEKPSSTLLLRPNSKPTKLPIGAGNEHKQQQQQYHHFISSTIAYPTTRRPPSTLNSQAASSTALDKQGFPASTLAMNNKWPATSRPKPTKKPPQSLPVYTKPIQQQLIVAVTDRPSSAAMQTTSTTTTIKTKLKPHQSSNAAPTTTTNRPTILKPLKNTQKPFDKTSATATTSTSTKTTQGPKRKTSPTISTALTSVADPSFTTIESNEITDGSETPSVKTISAARSECGLPVLARPETRIVGGKSAAFGRWPWQVSVRRTSFFGFSSTHRCGGALINENWIATAGHCVDDLLTSQIRIRVGEYDFSHVQEQLPYIERGVAKKVVHPQYNFFTYEYDLALVKLESPLEFAPHVSPICLPQTESLLIGMNATVTGWGRLSEGGTLPSVLQEVSVPIVSNDKCKGMFLRAGRQEFIPDIFLCAGYETGGQDSCQGDSGGPLQVKAPDGRFFLAGIISWGIGCAEANLPGVCTRISKFVPWILENVS